MELADAAGQPPAVTLFEGSPQTGGVFGTEYVDGYQLELGADMFITDKPWGLNLVRRLGLENRLITPDPRYRKSLILCRGRPVPTPEAFQLMVPGRVWPILTTPLLSPWGKLRLLCEPLIPRRPAGQGDESLADFVRRRLGREALERIVQPLVGGIYTGDPAQLSIEATLPRFRRMEERSGSLVRGMWQQQTAARQGRSTIKTDEHASGARYGLFVSLQDGMGELQAALRKRLAGRIDLHCESPVTRVDRRETEAGPRFRVATSATPAGSEFDAVIMAVPAHRAAELVGAWQSTLAGQLQSIEYASSVVVVTAHRLEDVAHPLDAYGLVIPHRERRRILAVSFLTRKFPHRAPAGRVVLRTFVGGALQPELCRGTDAELLTLVREELASVLGVRGEPELSRVVRYDRAMPQYHVGHLERVREIERLQESTPGLWLCGNAYRGVGIPDCIHDGEQAAEAAWARGG